MPVLTVKIDEALKNEAGVVLEELGLDIPTAVRMYLKAVVRENGLPISTKLTPAAPCTCACEAEPCCCCEETAAEPAVEEVVEEPAVEEVKPAAPKKVGIDDFVSLICTVPAGSVTRWKDMEEYLTAQTGADVVKPTRGTWPKTSADGLAIPYWRVLSERGAVRGDPKTCTKELQEEMLKAEGHEFVPAGHGIFSGIKVADYKKKLMKF